MAGPADPARKAKRIALARDTRRLAEEIESLYIELEQTNSLATIRRYMLTHQGGTPGFDMLHAAKALRSFAGVLSLISSPASQSAKSISQ